MEAGMPVLSNQRIVFIDSCYQITLISSPWEINSTTEICLELNYTELLMKQIRNC